MSSTRLPLSSRPSFLPDEIARREFATVFRGYDPSEVRTFLNQLSEQAGEASDRVAEIQKALAETEERVKNPELTEEMVTNLLGEQTAQILRSAREAANDIRAKAEEEVGRQLRDAHEVTTRMREEAEALLVDRTAEAQRLAEETRTAAAADADAMRTAATDEAAQIRKDVAEEAERARAELEDEIMRMRDQAEREVTEERSRARQQARDLVDTARSEAGALVERTQARQDELVEGLVRKRKIALAQVEELRAGRQRLLKAYKLVRTTLDEVTAELERVENEARQTAANAGQRAAAAAEISAEDMDTVIEIESFDLTDDVPQDVIDLVSEEGSDGAFSAEPLGDSEVVDLTDIDGEEEDEDEDGEDFEPLSESTSVFIGEAYPAGALAEMDDEMKAKRDAVATKTRSQAIRRLKRSLQDEQDAVSARLRTGEFESVQALLGSAEDQAAAYQRAVVKLLRETVRSGANCVENSPGLERGLVDRTGSEAARSLAAELVDDLRTHLQPVLEELLSREELPEQQEVQGLIAGPYREIKGDYLERLVDERVGGVFDQGVAFAVAARV